MRRTKWLFGALVVLAASGWLTGAQWRTERNGALGLLEKQRAMTETVEGRLASERLERKRYQELLEAADVVGGTVTHVVTIRVPQRDTVVRHEYLPLEPSKDGTYTAHFRDSTFAGTIAGHVVYTPPDSVGLTYQVTRPEFRPQVGFVQVGTRSVAVVRWQGERYEIEAPYAKLPPPPRIVPYVQAGYTLGGPAAEVGTQVRLGHGLSLVGAAQGNTGLDPGARVGVWLRKDW